VRSHVSLYLYYVTGRPADPFSRALAAFFCCENPLASKDCTPSFRVQRSSYSLQRVLDAVSSEVCQQG
jgi:hypothetical protein